MPHGGHVDYVHDGHHDPSPPRPSRPSRGVRGRPPAHRAAPRRRSRFVCPLDGIPTGRHHVGEP
ncbi:hypothetical protein C6Y14_35995 [Streptomyces dioscori]|uniref:Uncharacterized protein n=1 Tax=Streptomyces dioscori TaxID=2109333 RepID=A0A2P8PX43_9ACTN|nr:hypothetical protein C6Y14_35995 [Streptomyces dioscori]